MTISAADDADGLDGTATFTHSASSVASTATYDNIDIASVVATEADNDELTVNSGG